MFFGERAKAVKVLLRPVFLDEKGKLNFIDSLPMNKINFFILIHWLDYDTVPQCPASSVGRALDS